MLVAREGSEVTVVGLRGVKLLNQDATCFSRAASSTVDSAPMAESRYMPANSPAQGTSYGAGCRLRTAKISARVGREAGEQPAAHDGVETPANRSGEFICTAESGPKVKAADAAIAGENFASSASATGQRAQGL
jgi:hypothetical protein